MMQVLIEQAQTVKQSLIKKEKLPLWQYHIVAPFLVDIVDPKLIMRIVRRSIKTLENNPYPFTSKKVNERWDAVSLLAIYADYLNNELLEIITIMFWECLGFDAATVRANAALALCEIIHRIKNKSLLSVIAGRLERIIREDKSLYVKFWAKITLANIRAPKHFTHFEFFNKPNPPTKIKTTKLFHRFLRLWATGNIEFYQGNSNDKRLILNTERIERLTDEQADAFVKSSDVILPPSFRQFLTDVANGGQISRVPNNLFLLHKEQWLNTETSDDWLIPWVTILPIKPKWVSITEEGEFLPDELTSVSISKSLIQAGDEKYGIALDKYITFAHTQNDQIAFEPETHDISRLAYYLGESNNVLKHKLTFVTWINHPIPLSHETDSKDFTDLP